MSEKESCEKQLVHRMHAGRLRICIVASAKALGAVTIDRQELEPPLASHECSLEHPQCLADAAVRA